MGFNERLQVLTEALRQTFPEQIQSLALTWALLCEGRDAREAMTQLRKQTHSLSGVSGMYGLRDLHQSSADFEQLLDAAIQQGDSNPDMAVLDAAYIKLVECLKAHALPRDA